MAIQHFPDGITIGPGGENEDRLPIYEADSWNIDQVEFGEMAAGEVKVIELDGLSTLRFGAFVLNASPMNPMSYNNPDLLVIRAWCSENGKVKVMAKNISDASIDISGLNRDQWTFFYLNTDTPPAP